MDDTQSLWRRAEASMARRDGEAARGLYEAIVRRAPGHAAAWMRLSTLASMRGQYRDAVSAGLSAAAARPADPALRAQVFGRLLDVGEARAARDLYASAPAAAGTPTPLLAEFARLASRLGDHTLALELAEAAHAGGLRSPPLRYLLATTRIFSGDLDGAERELEACLDASPPVLQAHWTLAKLRRWTLGHHHVERLQRTAAALVADDPAAPYVLYALFKELDDLGRHPEAWDALMAGCVARRRQLAYDPAAEDALVDQLLACCTPSFLAAQAPAADGPVPVFIVGMPRSGTTLLERILGAHSQVADAGELYDFPFQMRWATGHQSRQALDARMVAAAGRIDFAELGRRYLAHTQWRARGRPYYTDKLPPNFMNLGFIHRALPQARVLHMVRDPMDTCFSNLKELFGTAYPHSYDQGEMARYYRNYRRVMDHWHAVLPGRIHDIAYADLVADPGCVARRALAFCGLRWEPGCLAVDQRTDGVSTASAVQVREPIHARNFAQWKPYEQQLEPLRQALA